ncbi:MAG: serine dehydratase subunit alpha family protein, partial [Bacteroidaceae bacterium]|nr:serine dehydratase subunit alpha family protein [Bacteroidaceae bacterium]
MLTPEIRQQITALVRHWVVPAMGCTEPICVALATAKATEILGTTPVKVEALLSANILKNAMGVGIPSTGMVGLPIAIALGALIGKSAYGLEVIKDSNAQAVEQGKQFINEGRISISLNEETTEKLYVEIRCTDAEGNTSRTIISGQHTNFTLMEKNGTPLSAPTATCEGTLDTTSPITNAPALTLRTVFDYATTAPLDEINFINEAATLNMAAAQRSLEGNYGHCLGKALTRPLGKGIMGESIFSHILSSTSCACDARMAGAMIPVMSNSGSG